MTVKVTFLWNLGGSGWSTTLYNTQISQPPSSNVLPPQVMAMGTALRQATEIGTNWIGTRISLVGGNRITFSQFTNNPVTGGVQPDYVASAGMILCRGQNNVGIRQFWVHAVASDQISYSGGVWTATGALLGYLNNIASLLSGGNGWALRTVPGRLIGPPLAIQTVTPTVQGGGTILAATGFVGTPPNPYIVSGFKYPLQHLNGVYTWPGGYTTAGGGSIVLNNRYVSTAQANSYVGGGTIRLGTPSYTNIAFAQFQFIRSRRIGRAFFVPRGRRSSK